MPGVFSLLAGPANSSGDREGADNNSKEVIAPALLFALSESAGPFRASPNDARALIELLELGPNDTASWRIRSDTLPIGLRI